MSISQVLPFLGPAVIYVLFTGLSKEGLILFIIPVLILVILLLGKVSLDKAAVAGGLSILSLGIYIIWYGHSIFDCGNSSNWFDLSGCNSEVHSSIATASVVLGISNIALLIFALIKNSKILK